MQMETLFEKANVTITVKRVYGEPINVDGVTVIPAADVRGGGGGGEGEDAEHSNRGVGGGFAVMAKPAGAFVVKDGDVRWRPAVDVNRLMATMAVMVSGIVVRTALRRRRDRHERGHRRHSS